MALGTRNVLISISFRISKLSADDDHRLTLYLKDRTSNNNNTSNPQHHGLLSRPIISSRLRTIVVIYNILLLITGLAILWRLDWSDDDLIGREFLSPLWIYYWRNMDLVHCFISPLSIRTLCHHDFEFMNKRIYRCHVLRITDCGICPVRSGSSSEARFSSTGAISAEEKRASALLCGYEAVGELLDLWTRTIACMWIGVTFAEAELWSCDAKTWSCNLFSKVNKEPSTMTAPSFLFDGDLFMFSWLVQSLGFQQTIGVSGSLSSNRYETIERLTRFNLSRLLMLWGKIMYNFVLPWNRGSRTVGSW
jgi:hypothetical protein